MKGLQGGKRECCGSFGDCHSLKKGGREKTNHDSTLGRGKGRPNAPGGKGRFSVSQFLKEVSSKSREKSMNDLRGKGRIWWLPLRGGGEQKLPTPSLIENNIA